MLVTRNAASMAESYGVGDFVPVYGDLLGSSTLLGRTNASTKKLDGISSLLVSKSILAFMKVNSDFRFIRLIFTDRSMTRYGVVSTRSAKHRRLVINRRGISAVISNMILATAVIAMGFAVLVYVTSTSESFVTEYNGAVSSDISKLQEAISLEYWSYNSSGGRLSVYFLNSGQVNNVNVTSVYVTNSSWDMRFSSVTLKYFNGTVATSLGIGEEEFIDLFPLTLVEGNSYTIKIITRRGSVFENAFTA